jgi:hypothetical protein
MPTIPPEATPAERAARFRRLLAMEIDRIVEDLATRRPLLLEVWGRHRDRGPFLDTLFSRWETVGFVELTSLDPEVATSIDIFYREVANFRLYVAYTQDMPSTLTDRLDAVLVRLRELAGPAIDALGGLPFGHRPPAPPTLPPLAIGPRVIDPNAPAANPVEYEDLGPRGAEGEYPPSPAQLAETEEERAARASWRQKGKVFDEEN